MEILCNEEICLAHVWGVPLFAVIIVGVCLIGYIVAKVVED